MASDAGQPGTLDHVPPLPGRQGAAPTSASSTKPSEPPPNDWRPSSTTGAHALPDFNQQRVSCLITGLFYLFCTAMPGLALLLFVAWGEHRTRSASFPLWHHGPCPPQYPTSVQSLPWWTTPGPPQALCVLSTRDGHRKVLLEHRNVRLATPTQAALTANLPAALIPRRWCSRRWWSLAPIPTAQRPAAPAPSTTLSLSTEPLTPSHPSISVIHVLALIFLVGVLKARLVGARTLAHYGPLPLPVVLLMSVGVTVAACTLPEWLLDNVRRRAFALPTGVAARLRFAYHMSRQVWRTTTPRARLRVAVCVAIAGTVLATLRPATPPLLFGGGDCEPTTRPSLARAAKRTRPSREPALPPDQAHFRAFGPRRQPLAGVEARFQMTHDVFDNDPPPPLPPPGRCDCWEQQPAESPPHRCGTPRCANYGRVVCSPDTCGYNQCANRALALDDFPAVEVRQSPQQGQMLYAAELIPAGTLITSYRGEVISETRRAAREATLGFGSQTYAMQYKEPGSMEPLYVVDARSRGSLGRFINHACGASANCALEALQYHHRRVMAFRATRDITIGEPIRFNYFGAVSNVPGTSDARCRDTSPTGMAAAAATIYATNLPPRPLTREPLFPPGLSLRR